MSIVTKGLVKGFMKSSFLLFFWFTYNCYYRYIGTIFITLPSKQVHTVPGIVLYNPHKQNMCHIWSESQNSIFDLLPAVSCLFWTLYTAMIQRLTLVCISLIIRKWEMVLCSYEIRGWKYTSSIMNFSKIT